MMQKNKIYLITAILLSTVVILLVAFFLAWPNRTTMKFIIENYKLGTFNPGLSEEELIQKRTFELNGITFTVPRSWSIMKDFPQKGLFNFELNLTKTDGSIELSVYSSNKEVHYINFDQPEVISQVNDWLESISTFSGKKAEVDGVNKSIHGITWKIVHATDLTTLGRRNTGIYYAVINGKLIRLYFFSIADSPAPIMHAVEELISRFHL